MKTSPRCGMAGPVLVSFTTSCARPPTATFWVAEVSMLAVGGTGLMQPASSSTSANSRAAFISLPYPLATHSVGQCLTRRPKSISDYSGRLARKDDVRNAGPRAAVSASREAGGRTRMRSADGRRLHGDRSGRGPFQPFVQAIRQPDAECKSVPDAQSRPEPVAFAVPGAEPGGRTGVGGHTRELLGGSRDPGSFSLDPGLARPCPRPPHRPPTPQPPPPHPRAPAP